MEGEVGVSLNELPGRIGHHDCLTACLPALHLQQGSGLTTRKPHCLTACLPVLHCTCSRTEGGQQGEQLGEQLGREQRCVICVLCVVCCLLGGL